MSRRLGARSVTVALIAAASLLGAAGLSSCASGVDAMTNQARTTTNSVSGAVGTIALRNVYVVGPVESGASTQVVSAFFNGGAEPDELIGISSPDAKSGTPPTDAALPPGGIRIFNADGHPPTLVGLNDKLLLGSQVPVTFTFAKAGSVTLQVPVEEPAPGTSGGGESGGGDATEGDATEAETTEAPAVPTATAATASASATTPSATSRPATPVPSVTPSATPTAS